MSDEDIRYVSDIAVTLMLVKPGEGYERVGQMALPAFFWVKYATTGDVVVDVRVLYGDAEPPSTDYTVLPESISGDDGYACRICFLRRDINLLLPQLQQEGEVGEEAESSGDLVLRDAVLAIAVASGEGCAIDNGYARLEACPLNPLEENAKLKEFLDVKTVGSQDALSNKVYKPNDLLDCLDTCNDWLHARVLSVNHEEKKIHVRYVGYSARWDEWIAVGSPRLADYQTKRLPAQDGRRQVFPFAKKVQQFDEVCSNLRALCEKLRNRVELNEEESSFLIEENRTWVFNALNAEVSEPEHFKMIQDYFKLNLDMVNVICQREDMEMHDSYMQIISLLFGAMMDNKATRYYERYGLGRGEVDYQNEGPWAQRKVSEGNEQQLNATQQRYQQHYSGYMIEAINYFGEIGGFDSMRVRIQSLKDNLRIIWFMLRALSCASHHINPEFSIKYCEDLAPLDVFKAYVDNVTDADLKLLDRDVFRNTLEDVVTILTQMGKKEHIWASARAQEMNLYSSVRLLQANTLEKRLNGLDNMHNILLALSPRLHTAIRNKPNFPRAYLPPEDVVRFLEDHKVVHLGISANPHDQMIKRTVPVLKFLAQYDALSKEHIETLWDAANSGHEERVRTVYSCFADLASELSGEQLDVLFDRIKATPIEKFKDFDLEFIKGFTENAVNRLHNVDKWYGLDLFWTMIQDEAKAILEEEIFTKVIKIFCHLLEQHQFTRQREVYLLKCLEKFEKGESVVQCLNVARKIIEINKVYPQGGHSGARDRVINELERTHNIVTIILTEINDFQVAAKKTKSDAKWNAEEAKAYREEHTKQLRARLDFLDFLSCNSSMLLNTKCVKMLFNSYVARQLYPSDQAMFLKWLAFATSKREGPMTFPAFSYSTLEFVFTRLLCNPMLLDFSSLNPESYATFQAFFLRVNYANRCLTSSDSMSVAVADFESLLGMDALWKLASTAKSRKVSSAAYEFLTTLFIRLDWRTPSDVKQRVWSSFVDHVISFLETSVQQRKAAAEEQKEGMTSDTSDIVTGINLLMAFLNRLSSGDLMLPPIYQFGEQVKAHWKGSITFYEAKVARVNEDGTYYLKFADGDEDEAVEERAIESLAKDEEARRMKLFHEDNDHWVPRHAIANTPRYFELIMTLLGDEDEEISMAVSLLVGKLPHNEELGRAITELSQPGWEDRDIDWETLLPADNIVTLLYSLQIVSEALANRWEHARNPEQFEQQRALVDAWGEMFVVKKGLNHLYQVMVTLDTTMLSDSLPKQECWHLVLHLVSTIFDSVSDKRILDGIVDDAVFLPKLIQILHIVSSIEYNLSENKDSLAKKMTIHANVTADAFMILRSRVDSDARNLKTLYDSPLLSTLVVNGLVKNENAQSRKSLVNGVQRLCTLYLPLGSDVKHPKIVFLPLLLSCMKQLDASSVSTDYFELISTLLRGGALFELGDSIDHDELVTDLGRKLRSHPIVETQWSKEADQVDELLCGLLTLLRDLIAQLPELKQKVGLPSADKKEPGLIAVLYDCLFGKPTPQTQATMLVPPPKCKSHKSRGMAFELLAELGKGCIDNTQELVELFSPNHLRKPNAEDGARRMEWNFESKAEGKSEVGYVGLRNLGCTCYMNSVLQQLYMVPELRRNILATDIYDNQEDLKESVIYQLQNIFGNLQESEKQYTDTRGLCQALKDWDGMSVNVSVQEDAGDFLNRIVDKIETGLKGSKHAKAVQCVTGTWAHEMIGQGECTHFRDRLEPFVGVLLKIQNKKNLHEALQAWCHGELLSGDNAVNCDHCNKKVDTLRRTCFKELPPVLFFVFNRFEMNYYTMQTTKINDRLEFPTEINLKPYTQEGLPRTQRQEAKSEEGKGEAGEEQETPQEEEEVGGNANSEAPAVERPENYYDYVLKGVVIHQGDAGAGHYYSFIQERLKAPRGKSEEKEGKWVMFNDHLVREFNPKYIPEEAFGAQPKQYGNSQYGNYAESSRNAYMLVYERKPVEPAIDDAKAESEEGELAFKASARTLSHYSKMRKVKRRHRMPVPREIFSQAWKDNLTYWENKAIFDPSYFRFMWEMISNIQKDTTTHNEPTLVRQTSTGVKFEEVNAKAIQLATRFVLWTLARAKDKDMLYSHWSDLLQLEFRYNVEAASWLLQELCKEENPWLADFTLLCTERRVRKAVSGIFVAALNCVCQQELETNTWQEEKSLSGQFVNACWQLLPNTPIHWKTFDTYFQLLYAYAAIDERFAQVLVARGTVARLVDYYLGDDSPHPEVSDIPVNSKGSRVEIGTKWTKPTWTFFMKLLERLVVASDAGKRVPVLSEDVKHTTEEGEEKQVLQLHQQPQSTLKPAALPEVDHEMLMSKLFVERLIGEATSKKAGAAIGGILCHLCCDNEKISTRFISYLTLAIDAEPAEKLRPYFRCLMSLMTLRDSLVKQRTEWILTSLLTSMETQQKYWKATDFCIEHLIRMAKKSPECYAYLQGMGDKLDWVLTWLALHQRPSNSNGMSFYKPSRVVNEWQGNGGYPTHEGLAIPFKKDFLDAVKEGKECELLGPNDAEDSDQELEDRVLEKGDLVDVLEHRVWKKGRVTDVTSEKACVVIEAWGDDWNDWYPMSSASLMPRGFHTDRPVPNSSSGGGVGVKRSHSDSNFDLGAMALSDEENPGGDGQDGTVSQEPVNFVDQF